MRRSSAAGAFAGADEPLVIQPDRHPGRVVRGGDDRHLDLEDRAVAAHPPPDLHRFDDPSGRGDPAGRCSGAVPGRRPLCDGADLQVGLPDLLEQRIEVGRRVQDDEVRRGRPIARPARFVGRPARRARLSLRPRRSGQQGDHRGRQQASQGPVRMPEVIQRATPSRMVTRGRDSEGTPGRPSPVRGQARPRATAIAENGMSGSDHARRPALAGAWPPPNYTTAT